MQEIAVGGMNLDQIDADAICTPRRRGIIRNQIPYHRQIECNRHHPVWIGYRIGAMDRPTTLVDRDFALSLPGDGDRTLAAGVLKLNSDACAAMAAAEVNDRRQRGFVLVAPQAEIAGT